MKKINLYFLVVPLILLTLLACKKDDVKTGDTKTIPWENNKTVKYELKVYHRILGDSTDNSDYAEIKIEYPEITNKGVVFDSINNFIQRKVHSVIPLDAENINESLQSLDNLADSFFVQYQQIQKDFPDYHVGWFIKSKITINGIYKNILTLKANDYLFTGGAHGNSNLLYVNFDLNNGEILKLKKIVDEKNMNELIDIGETIFRKQKKITTNSLNEYGYWFEDDKFSLPDNFAVTDSGMVFYYNPYEIASYAMGTTELFIPKEKLYNIIDLYKK